MAECTHLSTKKSSPEKVFLINMKVGKNGLCSRCVVCKNKRDNMICLSCYKVYCTKHTISHSRCMPHRVFYNLLLGISFCVDCNVAVKYVFTNKKPKSVTDAVCTESSNVLSSDVSRNVEAPRETKVGLKACAMPFNSNSYEEGSPCSMMSENLINLSSIFDRAVEEYIPMRYVPFDTKNITVVKDVFLRGIQNFGNTCYMNSVLQVLMNTERFKLQLFKSNHSKYECSSADCMICSIKSIFMSLLKNENIVPDKFLLSLMRYNNEYCNNEQHDVHNLYIDILSCLSDINNEVGAMFYGKIKTFVKCDGCNRVREQKEIFTSISLNFNKNLIDSVSEYFGIESINDKFTCEGCNVENTFTRQTEIVDYPPVLCLHIKRFKFDAKAIKLGGRIKVPRVLRVNSRMYKLYAFIVHSGDINHGHYVSYIRVKRSWYKFNDHVISQVKKEVVPFDLAYLLFYNLSGKV